MSLRVVIEHLVTSGTAVTGHGEDVAVAHSASDGRIEAAHPGWQGRSAAALAGKAAQWAEDSRTLVSRLSDHAQGLHASANEFFGNEERGVDALDAVTKELP